MERKQRTRLLSAGVLAVVFGSGVLIGIAFATTEGAAPVPAIASEPAAGPAPTDPPQPEERPRPPQRRALYELVGMETEQLQVADSLVRVHRAAVQSLQAEFRRASDSLLASSGLEEELRGGANALLEELRSGIRGLMSPEQRLHYDSLLAEDDRRRMEREDRQDPGSGSSSGPNSGSSSAVPGSGPGRDY